MLTFILGPSGSGKSRRMLAELRARAENGQRSLLIVPEQFTSSTEGTLYHILGDSLSAYVESYSFTSLAEALLRRYGGAAVETLSEAGRALLVRRAADSLLDKVVYYNRQRRSAAFCEKAAQTIEELKSAGITPDQLAAYARLPGADREKLEELSLIYGSYEAQLAQTAMDPGDRQQLAAQMLDASFFAGRAVYMDEFDTFNAPKRALLAAMLPVADVTVCLCCDGEQDTAGGMGLFSGVQRVIAGLKRMTADANVPTRTVVLTEDKRHAGVPALAELNLLLADPTYTPDCTVDPADPAIVCYAAASRQAEAKAVAAAIAVRARAGVPYSRMAVICRDTAGYLGALRYEFRLQGIPLFCDEATTPENTAPARAVHAALDLARGGVSSRSLLRLLKTGLVDLPEQQQCALENYAYTWPLRAADWREPFTRSAAGYAGTDKEQDRQTLADAEAARAFVMERVADFLPRTKNVGAAALTKQLYLFLQALGAEDTLNTLAETLRAQGRLPEADEVLREWNVVMGLLNEMAHLLGEQTVTVAEYEDLFGLLLRSSDLGHIPQTLDAVVLASAGKMRLDAPDYVFVLGLAEGEFPAAPGEVGLLTHADRDALMAQEIDLPDCFENRVVREQVCFYKALTAPAKGLWLSWPKGQGQTLCAALEPLVEALAPAAPELELTDLAATPADGLDCLGGGWPLTETERASLTEALHTPGETEPQGLALLRRMADTAPRQVHDLPALEALLGRKLRISPSQLEKYYTCRYGYFLQYVLGLRPRRRAELSADQSGTLMHWVLQMALDPHPGPDNPMAALQPFMELDDEAMASLAALLVDEYAKRYLPEDTARFAYLLSRLKKSMTSLLLYLRDEQRQSSFKPVACELKIGRGEDAVPAQVYHLSDGRTVQLVGTVDRADEWVEEDGTRWVRVVDYKTGTKKLDLKEVYCGLDCQMLLYLFSLTRDKSGRFTGAEPAGVLYLLADPAPETTTREKAAHSVEYKLDGLVRDEQKLFDAMDADETGRYLPFSYYRGAPSPYQKDKRADIAKLNRIQLHLDDLVTRMGQQLYEGQIAAEPLVAGRSPCQWCDYGFVCCHETGIGERALEAPAKPFEAPGQPEEGEEEQA